MNRRLIGAALIAVSLVLLFPPMAVVLAPIPFLFFNYYSANTDTFVVALGMLGGGGFVGGLWMMRDGRKSN